MLEKRFYKINTTDDSIRSRVISAIRDFLLSREDVAFAYLHGSFVEGGGFRDIDVAIFTEGPIKIFEIESEFSHELTERTGYPVEVRVMNNAPVAFRMAVLRKGRVLVSRSDETRTDFIENTGRGYREYSHFRNIVAGR